MAHTHCMGQRPGPGMMCVYIMLLLYTLHRDRGQDRVLTGSKPIFLVPVPCSVYQTLISITRSATQCSAGFNFRTQGPSQIKCPIPCYKILEFSPDMQHQIIVFDYLGSTESISY